MCAKIPTLEGYTNTGTIMSYGLDPYLCEISPFHGAVFSGIEAISKYVAMGGNYKDAWLTLQEYFEKLRNDAVRWGKPFAAVLGSYYLQEQLGIVAIGGKDSMSGSYNELDVPPTLTSFCVGIVDTTKTCSNELKKIGSKVYLLKTKLTKEYLPDFEDLKENYEIIHQLIGDGKVLSSSTIKAYGVADNIFKACIGNKIGFVFESDVDLFKPMFGSFIIEVADGENVYQKCELLGTTIKDEKMILANGEELRLEEAIKIWEEPLEKVFPLKASVENTKSIQNIISAKTCNIVAKTKFARPKVFIPTFPGTNTEYDLARAFEDAGAQSNVVVFRNRKPEQIEESILAYEKAINEAQIIMFPGGFSAGDEPDGSGKFIATIFRNPKLKEAIQKHLYEQDGLILRYLQWISSTY
jgi:phosphoribosylformylglycinamidine synthase